MRPFSTLSFPLHLTSTLALPHPDCQSSVGLLLPFQGRTILHYRQPLCPAHCWSSDLAGPRSLNAHSRHPLTIHFQTHRCSLHLLGPLPGMPRSTPTPTPPCEVLHQENPAQTSLAQRGSHPSLRQPGVSTIRLFWGRFFSLKLQLLKGWTMSKKLFCMHLSA